MRKNFFTALLIVSLLFLLPEQTEAYTLELSDDSATKGNYLLSVRAEERDLVTTEIDVSFKLQDVYINSFSRINGFNYTETCAAGAYYSDAEVCFLAKPVKPLNVGDEFALLSLTPMSGKTLTDATNIVTKTNNVVVPEVVADQTVFPTAIVAGVAVGLLCFALSIFITYKKRKDGKINLLLLSFMVLGSVLLGIATTLLINLTAVEKTAVVKPASFDATNCATDHLIVSYNVNQEYEDVQMPKGFKRQEQMGFGMYRIFVTDEYAASLPKFLAFRDELYAMGDYFKVKDDCRVEFQANKVTRGDDISDIVKMLNVPANAIKTDKEVVIAIIDSAFQQIPANASLWKNPGEVPGNGVDDDDNGYIDDINGADFDNGGGSSYDYHGTMVAQRLIDILKATNNSNIKLMLLSTGEYSSGVSEAVFYAYANGAKVINMSFVLSEQTGMFSDMLSLLKKANIAVVTAAGNESSDYISEPCSSVHENNLCVGGAFLKNGKDILISRYSNYHPTIVDVMAPTFELDGTSLAAPVGSYAAAMYLLKYPESSSFQAVEAIRISARPEQGLLDKSYSDGIIDITKLLATEPDVKYGLPDCDPITKYNQQYPYELVDTLNPNVMSSHDPYKYQKCYPLANDYLLARDEDQQKTARRNKIERVYNSMVFCFENYAFEVDLANLMPELTGQNCNGYEYDVPLPEEIVFDEYFGIKYEDDKFLHTSNVFKLRRLVRSAPLFPEMVSSYSDSITGTVKMNYKDFVNLLENYSVFEQGDDPIAVKLEDSKVPETPDPTDEVTPSFIKLPDEYKNNQDDTPPLTATATPRTTETATLTKTATPTKTTTPSNTVDPTKTVDTSDRCGQIDNWVDAAGFYCAPGKDSHEVMFCDEDRKEMKEYTINCGNVYCEQMSSTMADRCALVPNASKLTDRCLQISERFNGSSGFYCSEDMTTLLYCDAYQSEVPKRSQVCSNGCAVQAEGKADYCE